jgi:hypothetical protein
MSDRIVAVGYSGHAKLKMRTGGSTGSISKTQCRALAEGDGMYWDIAKNDGKNNVRLPVKYRYRSPVVFEYHVAGKRGAQAYAMIWLHHLVDNETTDMNIPIWTTKNGTRLIQNYVTEENMKAKEVPGLEDLAEIGRMHFRCRFKAGTDESHEQFVVDSDTRETYETWEACMSEGVRTRQVDNQVPDTVASLHEQSLTEGRDVLEQARPEERAKWMAKDGQDWSGAFGHDPKAYVDSSGAKRAEPGRDKPVHDPYLPSSDDENIDEQMSTDDDTDSEDLGISDATTGATGSSMHDKAAGSVDHTGDEALPKGVDQKRVNKRSEKRKQRGMMQWKPVRNMAFAKDEAVFGVKRITKRFTGSLGGREPDVETEVNT